MQLEQCVKKHCKADKQGIDKHRLSSMDMIPIFHDIQRREKHVLLHKRAVIERPRGGNEGFAQQAELDKLGICTVTATEVLTVKPRKDLNRTWNENMTAKHVKHGNHERGKKAETRSTTPRQRSHGEGSRTIVHLSQRTIVTDQEKLLALSRALSAVHSSGTLTDRTHLGAYAAFSKRKRDLVVKNTLFHESGWKIRPDQVRVHADSFLTEKLPLLLSGKLLVRFSEEANGLRR
ncbi:uncharacterized protein EI90DRAFT_3289277 [Cantharellus anzutake]|uniref:uncharacterized protein n=1 Tax=Cantharellus anzutake TaxID=1750568 RepID=UPI0019074670|nr:uncharacterized protein EI90DRAFT_3289277 [Cantharellus anzutake]KAF8332072.1 hypothetical protein EI90DRAFT_3289277 [Cantharellus anzutake]